MIDGQLLRYRRTQDGLFVRYSIGWNEVDDGATVAMASNSKKNIDPEKGDWVWRYPPRMGSSGCVFRLGRRTCGSNCKVLPPAATQRGVTQSEQTNH